jgi:hypothetical protein
METVKFVLTSARDSVGGLFKLLSKSFRFNKWFASAELACMFVIHAYILIPLLWWAVGSEEAGQVTRVCLGAVLALVGSVVAVQQSKEVSPLELTVKAYLESRAIALAAPYPALVAVGIAFLYWMRYVILAGIVLEFVYFSLLR